jgi:Tol biopolymer transport system component
MAFTGSTSAAIFDAILHKAPTSPVRLNPEVPEELERVVNKCLEKDRELRYQHASDLRADLKRLKRDSDSGRSAGQRAVDSEVAAETHPAVLSQLRRMALPWAVAVVAIAVAVWTGLRTTGDTAPPQPVVAAIPPPPGAEFLVDRGFALSPDSRQLVFAAREGGGLDGLWLRSLGTGIARRLAGTEEGRFPFWSPNGRHVAFSAAGKLKRIDVETEVVESLADLTAAGTTGAWSPQGEVLFSPSYSELSRVAARGGEPEVVLPRQVERLWPGFLPDGKRFLFLARDYGDASQFRQLRVGSLSGGLDQAVMRLNSNAVYAPPGHLVWWQDGNLRAQPFDTERLAVEGEPRVLAAGVQFVPRWGLAAFSLAGTTLVYREGGLLLENELVRLSRTGEDLGPVSPPGNYYEPRLSPDGSRVAVDRSDETNRGDIWVYEMERGTGIRLTTAPEDESDPVWSPNGSRLAYFAALGEGSEVRVRASGGVGGDERVSETGGNPSSWSPDGLLLVNRGGDIWVYALEDDSLSVYLKTPFSETRPTWSPDGRFVAYDSDETGRREVYIQTFPDPALRWPVSTDGGHSPAWRRDGGEIYYVNDDNEIVAVTVQEAPRAGHEAGFQLGPPQVLFNVDLQIRGARQYDTLDGETFIVNRNRRVGSTTPLTLVLNVDLDEGIRRPES